MTSIYPLRGPLTYRFGRSPIIISYNTEAIRFQFEIINNNDQTDEKKLTLDKTRGDIRKRSREKYSRKYNIILSPR